MRYFWTTIIILWIISLFEIIPEVLPEAAKLDSFSVGLIFMHSFMSFGMIYMLLTACVMLYHKVYSKVKKHRK